MSNENLSVESHRHLVDLDNAIGVCTLTLHEREMKIVREENKLLKNREASH